MNIAIGKFGKSIIFNESKWGPIGGDNEAPILFKTLADLNPGHKFYMIGKSDLKRNLNVKFKHDNVIDVWTDYNKKECEVHEHPIKYFKENNITIDAAIIYNGPTGRRNVVLSDEHKTLEMFKAYVSPIIYCLNELEIPWVSLSPDPRYLPYSAYDMFKLPSKNLSQWNGTLIQKTYKDYYNKNKEDLILRNIEISYSGIEKVCLINSFEQELNKKNNSKMVIVLNEGGNGGLLRGPLIEEWILNSLEDEVEIYGKWKTEKYLNDNRFKGSIHMSKFNDLFKDVKYTFIIPIDKEWTTSKIWEMINQNVIPFMHPYYDSQMNLNVPSYIRVNSPEELKEKIQELESNTELYLSLISKLKNMITLDDRNGITINNTIMNELDKIIK